jgi:hypothetical protein
VKYSLAGKIAIMELDVQTKARRAIEALRAGVPNRDAVTALGCDQSEIENKFLEQLAAAKQSPDKDSTTPGLLVEGGFGSGKSHLLEYFQHVALRENFICSKVVISKETPLHDPYKLYRAATDAAVVPGRRGAAITEIATQLNYNKQTYADFYRWLNGPTSGLTELFAATVFLFERLPNEPEVRDRIMSFWSGEPIAVSEVRKYLKACSDSVPFKIEAVSKRALALERFRFAPQLMIAAGYAGWVLLIDEVELIGRYSLMQRAKSYAEIARWLGTLGDSSFPGLTAVLAITDDFQSAVLDAKDDLTNVLSRMRAKNDFVLAAQADEGMKVIQRKRVALSPPSSASLKKTYQDVRAIYASAYDWSPTDLPSAKRLTTTRMREYVKGWITEWDLRRLDSEYSPDIEVTELHVHYDEDADLESSADTADE